MATTYTKINDSQFEVTTSPDVTLLQQQIDHLETLKTIDSTEQWDVDAIKSMIAEKQAEIDNLNTLLQGAAAAGVAGAKS